MGSEDITENFRDFGFVFVGETVAEKSADCFELSKDSDGL